MAKSSPVQSRGAAQGEADGSRLFPPWICQKRRGTQSFPYVLNDFDILSWMDLLVSGQIVREQQLLVDGGFGLVGAGVGSHDFGKHPWCYVSSAERKYLVMGNKHTGSL